MKILDAILAQDVFDTVGEAIGLIGFVILALTLGWLAAIGVCIWGNNLRRYPQ